MSTRRDAASAAGRAACRRPAPRRIAAHDIAAAMKLSPAALAFALAVAAIATAWLPARAEGVDGRAPGAEPPPPVHDLGSGRPQVVRSRA